MKWNMSYYKSRSRSFDSVASHERLGWLKSVFHGFKTVKQRKRSKSEKSVYSQTEPKSILGITEYGTQCSEVSLKMETTRTSLLESYIHDISENTLSQTDIVELEKQRKHFYKPIKILNKILHDVIAHFPDIEISLHDLLEILIDEICLPHIRLATMYMKRMYNIRNQIFNRKVEELHVKINLETESMYSPSVYDYGLTTLDKENCVDSFSDCNHSCMRYKWLNWNNDICNSNETIHYDFCQHVAGDKCNRRKEILAKKTTKLVKQTPINMDPFCNNLKCDEISYYHGLSTLQKSASPVGKVPNDVNEYITDVKCPPKECNHQLLVVTISPLDFSSICETTENIEKTVIRNDIKPLNTELSRNIEKTSYGNFTGLETNLSTPEIKKDFQTTYLHNNTYSMAKGDENILFNRSPDKDYLHELKRNSLENLKYSKDLEKSPKMFKTKKTRNLKDLKVVDNSSLNLDFDVLFCSTDNRDDLLRKSDFSVNDNATLDTLDESLKSKLGDGNTPIPVSISASFGSHRRNEMYHYRKCLDVSNSNCNLNLQPKINLFCESLFHKYDGKDSQNIFHCDTEMSMCTKFSKLPDQTVSITNMPSNHSDTVCEVLSNKYMDDNFVEKISKPSKYSVKFIENLSKEMASKSKVKSSFLRHTIASKLKIKNKKKRRN